MRGLAIVVRRLWRAPLFTLAALVTLGVGIGANTAVFSVVHGVVVKPLSYPASDRLVGVWHVAPGLDLPEETALNCSPTMFFTYGEENTTFESFGLWAGGASTVTGRLEPERVQTRRVTHGVLDALGVAPARGRWFSAEDDTPGAPETVILAHGYWQRRFGGADVLGQTLTVDARPRTIVGVMPAGFGLLSADADLFLPLRFARDEVFLGNFSYQGVARLRPGVTLEQVDADIDRMLGIWLRSWPAPPGFDASLFETARVASAVHPLKQDVVGDLGEVLWMLMGTMGLVLLIACANVANLLLVRAEARHLELTVRAALGAGWSRIARELVTESVVLGVGGGLVGLAVAQIAIRGLVSVAPEGIPRLDEIALDPTVLAFTAVVSLSAGVLFGLVPAFRHRGGGGLSAGDVGRTASRSRQRQRVGQALVVAQVALALVLLVGSGLMLRSTQALRAVPAGFSSAGDVQTVRMSVPESHLTEAGQVARLFEDIRNRIADIPGVRAVGFMSSAPMQGFNSNDLLYAQDRVYAAAEIPPIRRFKFVSPGAFAAAGIPLVAGRTIEWSDLEQPRDVAVVSEALARELWGRPDAALGRRIRAMPVDRWREIVGVVGDVRDDGLRQPAPTTVYWPALMHGFWSSEAWVQRGVTFLVRGERTGQADFVDQMRQAVWTADDAVPLAQIGTLREFHERSLARTSFTLVMLALAAAMALVLGVVGIYGVVSYAVAQQTREIGIRIALGARASAVVGGFVGRGAVLTAIGVVVGLGLAGLVTRFMTAVVFGVSPLDPLTFASVAVVLALVATLASYVPARRAASVDPMRVLRAD